MSSVEGVAVGRTTEALGLIWVVPPADITPEALLPDLESTASALPGMARTAWGHWTKMG